MWEPVFAIFPVKTQLSIVKPLALKYIAPPPKAELESRMREDKKAYDRVKVAEELMQDLSPQFTEWDEVTIRRLVQTVKVESSEWIEVTLTDGKSYRQRVENKVRKRNQ